MIVNFPEKIWGRLASIADNRAMTISELLVEAAELTLAGHSVPRVIPRSYRRGRQALDWDEVARLNGEGLSDMDIAARLSRPYGSVGNARRRMHLPVNHGPGGRPLNTNPKEGN
jgi:hypothetical protein